jgi:hypothetical protein
MWCRGGRRGGRPGGFKGGSRQKSRRPRDPEIEGISGRRAPGREGVRIEGAGDLPGSRGVSASPDTQMSSLPQVGRQQDGCFHSMYTYLLRATGNTRR